MVTNHSHNRRADFLDGLGDGCLDLGAVDDQFGSLARIAGRKRFGYRRGCSQPGRLDPAHDLVDRRTTGYRAREGGNTGQNYHKCQIQDAIFCHIDLHEIHQSSIPDFCLRL